MRLVAALVAVTGCVDVETTMPPWIPASDIAGSLATELGPPVSTPTTPLTTLRVATWNVELGADPEALAAEIRASPWLSTADVLLIQEIEDHPGEPGSRASRLAAALGTTWFYAPARIQGDGTHGDAILSHLPLSAPEVKHLPHIDMSIHARDRNAQRVVVDLGGGRTLPFVNIHLDTRINAVDRIRQLDPAVSDNPDNVVIGGDLNTLPWVWVDNAVPLLGTEAIVGHDQAQIVDDYLEALGFETPIAHDEDTHESLIDMRLDAICPRGPRVLAAGVDRTVTGSDHYAVWVDLAL